MVGDDENERAGRTDTDRWNQTSSEKANAFNRQFRHAVEEIYAVETIIVEAACRFLDFALSDMVLTG
jgi:hypothetical protein